MYSQQLKGYIEKVEQLNRLLKADGIDSDSYFEAAGLSTNGAKASGSAVGHRIITATVTDGDEFISSKANEPPVHEETNDSGSTLCGEAAKGNV